VNAKKPTFSADGRRARWLGAVLLLLSIAALLVYGLGTPAPVKTVTPRDTAASAPDPARPDSEDRAARERRLRAEMLEEVSSRSVDAADLIESVSVDKRRVCPGEDFAVTVRGKPENARSRLPIAELNFNVDGKFGNPIVLHGLATGTQTHFVVASNGVDRVQHREFQVEVLAPDTPECAGARSVTLRVERSPKDQDTVSARVVATHGLTPPLRYEWDFGDGAKTSGAQPATEHSYAMRDQTRGIAAYVVQVAVSDAAGKKAIGRDSVHLSNLHHLARAFGDRLTKTVYDRFPKPAPDGYRFDATFRNLEPDAVRYSHAKLTQKSCLAGREDRLTEVDASALSAPDVLEANAMRQVSLMIPRALVAADTCVLEVELTGDSIPPRIGEAMDNSPIRYRPVSTRFTFELRAAPPAEEGGASELASRRIEDPELAAKVLAAANKLGSSRVTPEQVEQLEREGQLP
jgi:hypothetical protein